LQNWRDLDFIGMELPGIKEILEEKFEFPDLERELADGVLSKGPFPIYMFMAAQRKSLLLLSIKSPFIFDSNSIGRRCEEYSLYRCHCMRKSTIGPNFFNIHSKQRGNYSSSQKISHELDTIFSKIISQPVLTILLNIILISFIIRAELPAQIYTLSFEGRKTVIDKLSKEQKHKISLLMPCNIINDYYYYIEFNIYNKTNYFHNISKKIWIRSLRK
jgi:hypothetical protein